MNKMIFLKWFNLLLQNVKRVIRDFFLWKILIRGRIICANTYRLLLTLVVGIIQKVRDNNA